jgi:glutamate synthase domain-containing protein 1
MITMSKYQMGQSPKRQGLYDPQFEHDACGVGMVCNLKGVKSHDVVSKALQILANLSHRGACGCDETTGDGAGILMQLPDKFLRKVAGDLKITLSSRTMVYKGLMLADQIEPFLPDLTDPDLQSGLALVHQRYSTNTFPTWDLAHPFRFLCHNGEINTVRGNVNWMNAREALFKSRCSVTICTRCLPIHARRQRLRHRSTTWWSCSTTPAAPCPTR